MMRWLFHPEAAVEIQEALDWNPDISSDLGSTFLEELESSLEFLARNPEIGAP